MTARHEEMLPGGARWRATLDVVVHGLLGEASRAQLGARMEQVAALDDHALDALVPLLEADAPSDVLRKAMRLCPALVDPGAALGACFARPRDELMRFAFQLRTLAAYLDAQSSGEDAPEEVEIGAWCRGLLEARAREDPENAVRFVRWCKEMIDSFPENDPGNDPGNDDDAGS